MVLGLRCPGTRPCRCSGEFLLHPVEGLSCTARAPQGVGRACKVVLSLVHCMHACLLPRTLLRRCSESAVGWLEVVDLWYLRRGYTPMIAGLIGSQKRCGRMAVMHSPPPSCRS